MKNIAGNEASASYRKDRKIRKRDRRRQIVHSFCKNKSAVFGLVVIILLALMALGANLIVPEEAVVTQDAVNRLALPSLQHIFGLDAYGRDVFARIVYGSRISLAIGIGAAAVSLIVGGTLGAVAAYYGGFCDSLIMRFMDMLMAIPATLLALTIVAALGTSMTNLMIAISIAFIPRFVRLVRSSVLPMVEMDYVEAARACGTSDLRIIMKDILPNAIGPIIVETTQSISGMILEASALSYIGMGVQPPTPEWGAMLSEAREFMRTVPHLIIIPGVFIILAALSFNLLGDGLRDSLDPKLKN